MDRRYERKSSEQGLLLNSAAIGEFSGGTDETIRKWSLTSAAMEEGDPAMADIFFMDPPSDLIRDAADSAPLVEDNFFAAADGFLSSLQINNSSSMD